MSRLAVVLLLGGCALRPPIEPSTACHIVQDSKTIIAEGSPKDLYELSYGTPVRGTARNAYAQLIASYAMTIVGAGALLGGLVTALATDPATQPGARTAGWALGGGAIGVAVVGIVLGYSMPVAMRHARERLRSYGERCQ